MADKNTNEPRALSAALAGPVFATRGGGGAFHAANRHVERWAPESPVGTRRQSKGTGTGSLASHPLRSLGFVDRLLSPWVEAAQRSASLKLFTQYQQHGMTEGQGRPVSWVFPRPWYQDELDWMAAARRTQVSQPGAQPSLFTTRGTYVRPESASMTSPVLPASLYEYVAPSLSVGSPAEVGRGDGFAPPARAAYSPLVPLAAVQAAEVMARTMARLPSQASTPALRGVLSGLLERAAMPQVEPTRIAAHAPELVTPPAPRADIAAQPETRLANQVAERYAHDHVQIAELQRITRQSVERQREEAARAQAQAQAEQVRAALPSTPAAPTSFRGPDPRGEHARAVEEARKAQVEAQQQLEERVARRVAERTAQRLHDQARSVAAEHARNAPVSPTPTSVPDQPLARTVAPPEVTAAIAALPPELASLLSHRPERSAQTIAELDQAYRTVELLARSAAAHAQFEVTRGPRLVMPSGLGGLVSALEHAPVLERPVAPRVPRPFARAPEAIRSRAMPWIASRPGAASSALGATATATPAALTHVAWSDRWLARFAGASTRSLETLSASTARDHAWQPDVRVLGVAGAAPREVFVSPSFGSFDASTSEPVRFDTQGHAVVGPSRPMATLPVAALAPTPALFPVVPAAAAAAERFDDDAETPDDVFAQIAETASQRRATPAPEPAITPSRFPPMPTTAGGERTSLADSIAHATPRAPSAGLAAQLAASPFAPALRHILSIPAATSFDVRALFGGALSASYLAGLLVPETHEIEIATGVLSGLAPGSTDAIGAPAERIAPSWDPAYVAPDTAGLPADELATIAGGQQMTTLRTALLSWEGEVASPSAAGAPAEAAAAPGEWRARPVQPSTARGLIDAMSLPLLGDVAPRGGESWAAPGMVAERAHDWSVAQERSAADLSFDFVPPELVLAARLYGLGPAEAAQAARIAIAGPGQLAAMASTVDRTFVQAMAYEAERRAHPGAMALHTAYPVEAGAKASVTAGAVSAPTTGEPPMPSTTTFGIERRAPRGAFLWPPATVAALRLDAASPEGQQGMSLAALELLAAQTVAELGTYAALGFDGAPAATAAAGSAASISPTADVDASHRPAPAMPALAPTGSAEVTEPTEPTESDVLQAAVALVPASRRARFDALYLALGRSPSGVAASPAARAARALALAGRGEDTVLSARERAASAWDVLPVVYAADFETLAHDGLLPGAGTPSRGSSSTPMGGRAPAREVVAPTFDFVDGRPGLGGLSARAGEALGSYVAPSPPPTPAPAPQRDTGAVLRAPTAAQEMVQTGRPSGRFGGGEVEIPTWFEAAARKMFESQSGGLGGDISIAELTLISNAPSNQIAASTRATPGSAPAAPSANQHAEGQRGMQVDVEKIANEIYRQILAMMDAARARNGEPYL